ncbi:MAG: hypothetical protein ABIA77_06690, partial [Candidatus Omnitrophota bacterium]
METKMLAYRTLNHGKPRVFLKAVALFISFVFLIQQVVFADGNVPSSVSAPLKGGRLTADRFSIPRDVAITKAVEETNSPRMIINIKDAHDNYGAQTSIVDVLENLLVNYDIRFVGIEGSEGYIDTSIISAFPDDAVRGMTADHLMREGKISAGEFFAATSNTPITLYGIDDSELYVKNYNSFLNLLEFKKENLGKIDALRRALYALEDHVFSEDLKSLNHNSILNNTGQLSFTKRWDCIKEVGLKYGIKPDEYPNISALMTAVELEKKIDYDATNLERDELLDLLTKRLKREPLEKLVLKSLAFKLGRISKSQFYTYLLFAADEGNVDKSLYPNLVEFCDYVNIYEAIDIACLMDEIDEYECHIREKLYRDPVERELTKLLKDTEILHNLYAVRLTSGQLKYLMSHMDELKWEIFLDFLKKEYGKYNLALPGELAGSALVFERLPKAITFYEAATARNREMVNNTIEMMKKNNVDVAAVITGGFHTRGITDILRSEETSYLILLPRFNAKTGKRPYVTILTNKANEYKKYTESGEYLAVTSFLALLKTIREGTGMAENAKRVMYETIAVSLGLADFLKREKGVLNGEILKKLTDTTIEQYLERLTKARDAFMEKGLMTADDFQYIENLLKNRLEITSAQRNGKTVTLLGIKGEEATGEGNYLYYVSLSGDREASDRAVEAEKYEGVSAEDFNKIFAEKKEISLEAAAGEKLTLETGMPALIDMYMSQLNQSTLGARLLSQTMDELLKKGELNASTLKDLNLSLEKIAARKGIQLEKDDIKYFIDRLNVDAAKKAEQAQAEKARQEAEEAAKTKAEEERYRSEVSARAEAEYAKMEREIDAGNIARAHAMAEDLMKRVNAMAPGKTAELEAKLEIQRRALLGAIARALDKMYGLKTLEKFFGEGARVGALDIAKASNTEKSTGAAATDMFTQTARDAAIRFLFEENRGKTAENTVYAKVPGPGSDEFALGFRKEMSKEAIDAVMARFYQAIENGILHIQVFALDRRLTAQEEARLRELNNGVGLVSIYGAGEGAESRTKIVIDTRALDANDPYLRSLNAAEESDFRIPYMTMGMALAKAGESVHDVYMRGDKIQSAHKNLENAEMVTYEEDSLVDIYAEKETAGANLNVEGGPAALEAIKTGRREAASKLNLEGLEGAEGLEIETEFGTYHGNYGEVSRSNGVTNKVLERDLRDKKAGVSIVRANPNVLLVSIVNSKGETSLLKLDFMYESGKEEVQGDYQQRIAEAGREGLQIRTVDKKLVGHTMYGFKVVNDTIGHIAADETTVVTAEIVSRLLSENVDMSPEEIVRELNEGINRTVKADFNTHVIASSVSAQDVRSETDGSDAAVAAKMLEKANELLEARNVILDRSVLEDADKGTSLVKRYGDYYGDKETAERVRSSIALAEYKIMARSEKLLDREDYLVSDRMARHYARVARAEKTRAAEAAAGKILEAEKAAERAIRATEKGLFDGFRKIGADLAMFGDFLYGKTKRTQMSYPIKMGIVAFATTGIVLLSSYFASAWGVTGQEADAVRTGIAALGTIIGTAATGISAFMGTLTARSGGLFRRFFQAVSKRFFNVGKAQKETEGEKKRRGPGIAHKGAIFEHGDLNEKIKDLFFDLERELTKAGVSVSALKDANGNFDINKLQNLLEENQALKNELKNSEFEFELLERDSRFIVIARGIESHCGRRTGNVWISREDIKTKAEEFKGLGFEEDADAERFALEAIIKHEQTERDELLIQALVSVKGISGEEARGLLNDREAVSDAVKWLENEDKVSDYEFTRMLVQAHEAAVIAEDVYIGERIAEVLVPHMSPADITVKARKLSRENRVNWINFFSALVSRLSQLKERGEKVAEYDLNDLKAKLDELKESKISYDEQRAEAIPAEKQLKEMDEREIRKTALRFLREDDIERMGYFYLGKKLVGRLKEIDEEKGVKSVEIPLDNRLKYLEGKYPELKTASPQRVVIESESVGAEVRAEAVEEARLKEGEARLREEEVRLKKEEEARAKAEEASAALEEKKKSLEDTVAAKKEPAVREAKNMNDIREFIDAAGQNITAVDKFFEKFMAMLIDPRLAGLMAGNEAYYRELLARAENLSRYAKVILANAEKALEKSADTAAKYALLNVIEDLRERLETLEDHMRGTNIDAHFAHAPPFEATSEEVSRVLKVLMSKNPEDITKLADTVPDIEGILAYFATQEDARKELRAGARKAILALAGLKSGLGDLETENVSPGMLNAAIGAYYSEDKDAKKGLLLDMFVRSASIEDEDTVVRKNGEQMAGVIDRTMAIQKKGNDFVDRLRGIKNRLDRITILKDKLAGIADESGLAEAQAKEQLTQLWAELLHLVNSVTGAKIPALDTDSLRQAEEKLRNELDALKNSLVNEDMGLFSEFRYADKPPIFLRLQNVLEGMNTELADIFRAMERDFPLAVAFAKERTGQFKDFKAPLMKDVLGEYVDDETRKKNREDLISRIKDAGGLTAVISRLEKERLDEKDLGFLREKLKEIEGTGDADAIIRILHEDIAARMAEVSSALFRSGNGKQASRILEELMRLHDLSREYYLSLDKDTEVRKWAAWLSDVREAGGNKISRPVRETIDDFLRYYSGRGSMEILNERQGGLLSPEERQKGRKVFVKAIKGTGRKKGLLQTVISELKALGADEADIKELEKKLEEIKISRDETAVIMMTHKDVAEHIVKMIKKLLAEGRDEKAAEAIELLMRIHKLSEDHFKSMDKETEIKDWAKWIRALTDVWNENIGNSVRKDIQEILADIVAKGEELSADLKKMAVEREKEIKVLEYGLGIRTTELAKKKESIASKKNERGYKLSPSALVSLGEQERNLEEAIAIMEKEKENLEKKRDNIRTQIVRVENAVSGTISEEDRKALEDDLAGILTQEKVQEGIGLLKARTREKVQKYIKTDKDGNRTIESMKEAYKKSLTEYDKFAAMAYADLSMSMKSVKDYHLYEVQLLAGLLSADGKIVNVATGEGKTEFAVVAQTIAALTGFKVLAETSNENLARKDFYERKGVFDFMGLKSALFSRSDIDLLGDAAARDNEVNRLFDERFDNPDSDVDIVVIDTSGFNFQVATEIAKSKKEQLIKSGRKFMFIITDEIDAAMRDASTQYRIALPAEEIVEGTRRYSMIKSAVGFADEIVNRTDRGRRVVTRQEEGDEKSPEEASDEYYYTMSEDGEGVNFTAAGKREIRARCGELLSALKKADPGFDYSADDFYRMATLSIEMLETSHMGADHDISATEIKLYDTGGLLGNRRLSDGRHTILEMYAREFQEDPETKQKGNKNIIVRGDSSSTSEIGGGPARTEFFAFQTGSSGTALSSINELKGIFGSDVLDIPTHIRRDIKSSDRYVVDGKNDKVDMLRAWLKKHIKRVEEGGGVRYILPSSFLHLRDYNQAWDIQKLLKGVLAEMGETDGIDMSGVDIQIVHGLLKGKALNDAIKMAGNRNVITIFTAAGARGTDYQAKFKNIKVFPDMVRAENFAPLLNALGYAETDADGLLSQFKTSKEAGKLQKILLDLDKDEYRAGKKREDKLKELDKFFDDTHAALTKEWQTAKDKNDINAVKTSEGRLRTLNDFRIDVETRYSYGFSLLSQISDKSVGDLLQALGRVGRQSDPAEISLFYDISEAGGDRKIIARGFAEESDQMKSALNNIAEFRRLTDRQRKGEALTVQETEERLELAEKIYEDVFDALVVYDEKGQKRRIENHEMDTAVFRFFTEKQARYRADFLDGKFAVLTREEIAARKQAQGRRNEKFRRIDEFVRLFETEGQDAAKLRTLGERFMREVGDVSVKVQAEGGVPETISVRNLTGANARRFAEGLKKNMEKETRESETRVQKLRMWSEYADKWIDDIVKQFEEAGDNAEKIRHLQLLFFMAFGDREHKLMDGLKIKREDGGEDITVYNLDSENIAYFAAVLKALVTGKGKLPSGAAKVVSKDTFGAFSKDYTREALLGEKFPKFVEEAVAELLQYRYFEQTAKLRGRYPSHFTNRLSRWCDECIRAMPGSMPSMMTDICLKGLAKELDKPLSANTLKSQAAKVLEVSGGLVTGALKSIKKKPGTRKGELLTDVGSFAVIGASLGSVIAPFIGTAAGGMIGAAAGWLLNRGKALRQKKFGYNRIKEESGKAAADAALRESGQKGAMEGLARGSAYGAAITGVFAVIGGIAGSVSSGPVGVIPGAVLGVKIGGGVSALLALGLGWRGARRARRDVYMPPATRVADKKDLREKEERPVRIETPEEFMAPLAREGQHVREVTEDTRARLIGDMLNKNADGRPSPTVMSFLKGERPKTESRDDIRGRIEMSTKTINISGKEIQVRVASVKPEIGSGGKPGRAIDEGLNAEERGEALRVYIEEYAVGGAPKPGAPDFVCIPYGAFFVPGSQDPEDEGKMDRARASLVAANNDIREDDEPLVIFADGMAAAERAAVDEFKGHVSMPFVQASAMAQGAVSSGVPVNLTLKKDETHRVVRHNGDIILMIKSDDGRPVIRNFGRELDEHSLPVMRAMIGLSVFKSKGKSGLEKEETPEGRAMRAKMASLGGMAGMDMPGGGDAVDIALLDPIVRSFLDNTNADSGDIVINAEGIYLKRTAGGGDIEEIIRFEDGSARITGNFADISKVPVETVAIPFETARMRMMQRLLAWTGSRLSMYEYLFKTEGWVRAVDEKLEKYPRIRKVASGVFVSARAWVSSLHLFSALLYAILIKTGDVDKWLIARADKLARRFTEKTVLGERKEKKPDRAELKNDLVPPVSGGVPDPDKIDALSMQWTGTIDPGIINALNDLAANSEDAGKYAELADILKKKAEDAERDKGAREALKIHEIAARYYHMAVFLDGKTARYRAGFAKALDTLGKKDEALKHADEALKRRFSKGWFRRAIPRGAERDGLLLRRADILAGNKKYGRAHAALRELYTAEAIKKSEGLRKRIDAEWKEQEEKDGTDKEKGEKEKLSMKGLKDKFSLENMKKAAGGKKMFINLAAYGAISYILNHLSITLVLPVLGIAVPPFAVSSLLVYAGTIIIGKWIYGDIYKGLIKGDREYSRAKSMKKGLAVEEAYARNNPADIEGHLRLVNHYLEAGMTDKAMRHIKETVARFCPRRRHAPEVQREFAERLTLFSVMLPDLDIKDKDKKEEVRAVIHEKTFAWLNGQMDADDLINLLAAKLAFASGDMENASGFIDNAFAHVNKKGYLISDLDSPLNRQIIIMRAKIAERALGKMAGKKTLAQADKNDLRGLTDEIQKIDKWITDNARFFPPEEMENLRETIIASNQKLSGMSAAEIKAGRENIPEKGVSPDLTAPMKIEAAEKEAEKDMMKTLEARLKANPMDNRARIELAELYIKKGKDEYGKAEEVLKAALEITKDAGQASNIAETLVAIQMLSGEGAFNKKLAARITDPVRKSILEDLLSLKTARLPGNIVKLIPMASLAAISRLDSLFLLAVLRSYGKTVANNLEIGYLAAREDALASFLELQGLLKDRKFDDTAVKNDIDNAIGENINILTAASEAAFREAREYRQLGRRRGELAVEIEKLTGPINLLEAEISALSRAIERGEEFKEAEEELKAKKKEMETKKGYLENLNALKARKRTEINILLTREILESDPAVMTRLLDELFSLQNEYITDAGSNLKERLERSRGIIDELEELISAFEARRVTAPEALSRLTKQLSDVHDSYIFASPVGKYYEKAPAGPTRVLSKTIALTVLLILDALLRPEYVSDGAQTVIDAAFRGIAATSDLWAGLARQLIGAAAVLAVFFAVLHLIGIAERLPDIVRAFFAAPVKAEEDTPGARRDRAVEVMDRLVALLNRYGGNDEIRAALVSQLDPAVKRYVSLEEELAAARKERKKGRPETEIDRARRDWKSMSMISARINSMNDLSDWNALLRIRLYSRYLSLMFTRSGENRPFISFDGIYNKLQRGALSLNGKVKDAVLEEMAAIAKRNITRDGGEDAEYLADFLMDNFRDADGYTDLFMKIAEARFKDSRDSKNLVPYAEKYAGEKLREIRDIPDEKGRRSELEEFVKWMDSLAADKLREAALKQCAGIEDAAYGAEVMGAVARSKKLPAIEKINASIFVVTAAGDGKTREDAMSELEKTVKGAGKKEMEAGLADNLIKMSADRIKAGDLTEREAARIFNLFISLRGKAAENDKKNIDAAMEKVYAEIIGLREKAMEEAGRSGYGAVMSLVDAKIKLAEFYERESELEKARKELEEANGLLGGEMRKVIELQRDDKLSRYGGPVEGIIRKSTDVTGKLETVLRKMDKLDAAWFISRARGEMGLAKYYIAVKDTANARKHLEGYREGDKGHMGAFGLLTEARRRDPAGANLPVSFDLARLLISRIVVMEKLGRDDVVLDTQKREKLLSEEEEIEKRIEENGKKKAELEKKIADSREKSRAYRRISGKLEQIKDGKMGTTQEERVFLEKKYTEDLRKSKEAFGITATEKELENFAKQGESLAKDLANANSKLALPAANIAAFYSGGLPPDDRQALIFNAISAVMDGDDVDDDVKEAREFLIDAAKRGQLPARELLFTSFKKKEKEILDRREKLGRTEREKEFTRLKGLAMEAAYESFGKEGSIDLIKNSQNNLINVDGMMLDADVFLDHAAKKFEGDKGELIAALRDIAENADDGLMKLMAEEKLLTEIFGLIEYKDKPELLKDKTADEARDMLYRIMAGKLSKEGAAYSPEESLLNVIAPALQRTADELERRGEGWDGMEALKRRVMLAGENEEITGRMYRLEAARYNAAGYIGIAKKEYADGGLVSALDNIDMALALAPDPPEANLLKAKILRHLGRPHDAIKLLKKAVEKDKENEDVLKELIRDYRAINDGISLGDTALKLSELYLEKAEADGAKRLAAVDSGKAPWKYAVSSRNNYKKAAKYAKEALEARPRLAKTVITLAKALNKIGETGDAVEMLGSLAGNAKPFMTVLYREERGAKLRLPGRIAAEKEAFGVYGPIITDEDARALVEELAGIYLSSGDKEDAAKTIRLIEKYRGLMKKSARARVLLGKAYGIRGKVRRSEKYFAKAGKTAADDIEAQETLIAHREGKGGFGGITQAIRIAEEAAKKDTAGKNRWNAVIARLCLKRSRLSPALAHIAGINYKDLERRTEDVKKALAAAKDLPEKDKALVTREAYGITSGIYEKLIMLRAAGIRRKERDKRREDLAELRLEILDMTAGLAETVPEAGIDKPIDELEGLPQIQEKVKSTLSRALALKAGKETDPDKRLALYARAAELDNKNYKAHFEMGLIYELMGDLELAAISFAQAKLDKELEGDDLEVTRALINVYEKLGEAEAEKLNRELKRVRRAALADGDRLAGGARATEALFDIADRYAKMKDTSDAMKEELDQMEGPGETVQPGDADDEIDRALEFLELDRGERENVEIDAGILSKELISTIAAMSIPERAHLMKQLIRKLEAGDADRAINRLEPFLPLMKEEGQGREFVLLSLAGLYERKGENEKAMARIEDLSLMTGVHYNMLIEASLIRSAVYRNEGKDAEAVRELLKALDVYRREALDEHEDGRMKARLAGAVDKLLKYLKSKEADIAVSGEDLAKFTHALKPLDNFDLTGDLIALILFHAKDKIVEVAQLLKDKNISKENKRKIIGGLLAHLRIDTRVVDAGLAGLISPMISEYAEKDPAASVQALLAYLYGIENERIKHFFASRKAKKGEEKVEKDSSYYYDLGGKALSGTRNIRGLWIFKRKDF